jgi:hypothetical protein
MRNLHLISEGFSQAHHAPGIPQINGLQTPLTMKGEGRPESCPVD